MSETNLSPAPAGGDPATPPPAPPRPAGVLAPWQRRLYTLLLVPLGAMAANSIYLYSFAKNTAFFMVMLLLHLVLGLLIAVPFFVFAVTHARKMFATRNRRAKGAGIGIVLLAATVLGTGLVMTFDGATLENRLVWFSHVLAIPLALVAFILHRRAHTHQLAFRKLALWGGAVAAFLGGMAILHLTEKPPQRIVNRSGDTQFFPSSAETADGGLLDPVRFSDNGYCKDCHPDSFARWEKSAHRFSSFNNPFYRRSVELMADQVGREKTKWCAGCHDPVVLFSGKMGKATLNSFTYDDVEAQQGLPCMGCHSIVEVKDTRGNGGYVIEESKQYPFAFTKNPVLKEVNQLLIRMEPSLHRATFLKPFMREPEFCSACHKVALLPPVNEYKWLRGQNHYDTWQDSGVSGYAVRSFYDPPKAKACRDCHLPDFPSKEFGSRDGKLHDHLFPAANTALPTIRGDSATVETIRKFLEGSITADLFAIRRGDQVIPIGPELPTLVPGETVVVELVLRTRRLGHPYTNGTADSNETWASFRAEAAGTKLFESGVLGPDGRLDLGSDRLNQIVLAHDGTHMDRRQPQDIHVPLYNNQIGPGAARVIHYQLKVPVGQTAPVELSAGLHYRKFSRDYSIFVHGPDAPELPVVDLSVDRVSLPVAGGAPAPAAAKRANEDKPWQRWNDYGIGLFLQGDLKGAARAWTEVAKLAPEVPDGPLNLARALIAEGNLPDAERALTEADRRRPGWGKTAFFRAMLHKERGQLDEALADLVFVTKKFPKDRVCWNQVARIHFLAGRYREALEAIRKVREIDAEDLASHYTAMLCFKALGMKKEAEAEEAWYRYHKDDETAPAVQAAFRRANPLANRESLPVHLHDDPVPVFPDPPGWLDELGPKGYEYLGNAPAGEQILRDDRPVPPEIPAATPAGG